MFKDHIIKPGEDESEPQGHGHGLYNKAKNFEACPLVALKPMTTALI
jgi:hypothetical protein